MPVTIVGASVALMRRLYYSEPDGSVSVARPHVLRARRSHAARGARAPRPRQRDDQRARRAVRHLADRDEEARAAARGGGARLDREGRAPPPLRRRPAAARGCDGLDRHLPADARRPPRPFRRDARAHEGSAAMTSEQKTAATVTTPTEREIYVE